MVTAVILAAGESRRLGTAKQLLKIGEKSLIARMVEAALESRCVGVTVIVGASGPLVRAEIEHYDVRVVDNPHWNEGKASSIRLAVDVISQDSPPASGVLFLVCDQPRVTAALLNQMLDRFEASAGQPVACEYGGTMGVPVIIPRRLFAALKQLSDDQGSKKILHSLEEMVERVPFAEGTIDIDSAADAGAVGDKDLPGVRFRQRGTEG